MSNQSLVPSTNNSTVPQIAAPFDHSNLMNKLKNTYDHVVQLCEDTENDRDAAESELITIADNLQDVSDFYNGSLTFCQMGGLKCIKAALNYSSYAVKSSYLDVLVTISQNNEEVQNFIYKNSKFIQEFANSVEKDNIASIYRTRLLSALSALIRGNAEGKRLFFDVHNGIETLQFTFNDAFVQGDSRVANKAAIVAFHFFKDNSENTERQDALRNLVTLIRAKMMSQADKYEESIEYTSDL